MGRTPVGATRGVAAAHPHLIPSATAVSSSSSHSSWGGRSRVPTKLRVGAPREVEVLCPPARMARGVPFETWCEENGERGARLLAEYADTEKSAREVTKGSHHRALWS
jgi:hypothetical protein